MIHHSRSPAFTLIEMSIVLVVIALLIGGVLEGQSLRRGAEIRSVISDYRSFVNAYTAFHDKYNAIPGDMANATTYWGTDPSGCPATPNAVPKTATCNGDGDGMLDVNTPEDFTFWQQLANSGFLSGSYSGASADNTSAATISPGLNIPASRLTGAVFTARYLLVNNLDATGRFVGTYPNHLQFGGPTTTTNVWNDQPVLTPAEAWNLDLKIDDGTPATGMVVPGKITTCTTAATHLDYSATYAVSDTTLRCVMHFMLESPFYH